MIDTVTFHRPFHRDTSEPPPDWRFKRSRAPLPEGHPKITPDVTYEFDHKPSGYHGYGKADYVLYHTGSLPRFLFGHNGRLIQNQVQIDAALNLIRAKAGELGTPPANPDLRFTRVDLCWQFVGDSAQFVLAHRACRHPRIRSNPIRYEDRSIAFNGSELRVIIYDKFRERFKRNGNVVRVEVGLRGQVLRDQLGDGDEVTHLDFNTCYRAFRQILTAFEPSPVPQVTKIAHLLAIGEKEGWESDGMTAFELYTANESDRTVRRLKRQMAQLRPAIHQIDWLQLLPADGPPPVVELPAIDDPEDPA